MFAFGEFSPSSILLPRGTREAKVLQHSRAAGDDESREALLVAAELLAGITRAELPGGEIGALADALEALRVALGGAP